MGRDPSTLIHNTQLKPRQIEAVEKLSTTPVIINALQTGCGKTIVTLTAALEVMQKNPTTKMVILAPKSSRAAWKKELKDRVQKPFALITAEETIEYTNQPFIIVEQSVLNRNVDLVKSIAMSVPSILAIDEAHYLQNKDSNLSKATAEIRPLFPVCWPITATPLLNDIEGLHSVLEFTDPNIPNWWRFRDRYCVTRERQIRVGGGRTRKIQEIVDYQNLEELAEIINSHCIQGGQTYNIHYNYIKFELDERFKEPYTRYAKGLDEEMNEKGYGARLHDLQRIVDGSLPEVQSRELSHKEIALYNLLKKIMKRNESVLVYSPYEDTIDRLTRVLTFHKERLGIKKLMVMTGANPERERVLMENSIEPGTVLIISNAGKQSRNLQKANHVILTCAPWSVGDTIQILGRICRTDTTFDTQYVHTLEATDTIDTYRRKLFQDNVALINALFSQNPVLPTDVYKMDRENLAYYKRMYLWNPRK